MVRGKGGGKTRALEELRREMMKIEDVLPIAITFDSYWSFDNDDKSFDSIKSSWHFIELSIVSRIASMVYEINLFDIQKMITQNVNQISETDIEKLIPSLSLI